jgi:zinc protease
VDQKIASSASGWYSGGGLDSGRIGVSAVVAPGSDVAKVEAAIDAVLAEIKAKGVTQEEVERGKKAYLSEYIYESDNQGTMARRYGWAMVLGRSVADTDRWPADFAKVTAEEVKAVANKYLNSTKSVTGILIPSSAESTAPAAGAPPADAPARAPAAGKKS